MFIHIPKTGRMSISTGLFGEFPYHYPAWKYQIIYGKTVFQKYFKFTIVRNPWDRPFSAYHYLQKGGWNNDDAIWFNSNLAEYADFNDFVLNWLNIERLDSYVHFVPQYKYLVSRRNELLVDYVGYYETLEHEYNYLSHLLGVQARSLPHTNSSSNPKSYKEIYTDASANKVARLYARDIELLGYEFDKVNRISIAP